MRRIERDLAATNRLRTEGTDHLLSAARAAGACRFVAQSFASYYARTGGWIKTEADPLDADAPAAVRPTIDATRYVERTVVDDDPAPEREWLPAAAEVLGAKPPMRVPRWLARLLAGELAAVMLTEGRGGSNAKAKRELGWRLRYRAGGRASPRVSA
jgi:nucleoside-diphosphate-sugar epimerase